MSFKLLSKISSKESEQSENDFQNQFLLYNKEFGTDLSKKDRLNYIAQNLNRHRNLLNLKDVGLLIERKLLDDMQGHPFLELDQKDDYNDLLPRKMLLMREYQQISFFESRKQDDKEESKTEKHTVTQSSLFKTIVSMVIVFYFSFLFDTLYSIPRALYPLLYIANICNLLKFYNL